MARTTADTLEESEVDAFLDKQTTGTLSLAKDDDAYAVPVAYTYEETTSNFYFRLGYGPGSDKREYADASETVTFVVANETPSGWKSVVARGELEHLSTVEDLNKTPQKGPADPSVSQSLRNLEIPFYRVFEEPSDMMFALARLRTDEVTGVAEGGSD